MEKQSAFRTFKRAMETRETDSVVNDYIFEDGRKGWYEVSVYPVPEGILCISRDITGRKQAEEAVRESEARYRELANSITDVFFAMDKDLRYTYWNRASEELTGIAAKDAIGKSLYDLFPDIKGTVEWHSDAGTTCRVVFAP